MAISMTLLWIGNGAVLKSFSQKNFENELFMAGII